MRLIDADALKNLVEKVSCCGLIDLDVLKIMIDDAPTIDIAPKWIPCEERLPKDGEWVLCQCRAKIIDVLRLKENGLWENLNLSPYVDYIPGFVIAWIPLPEPYDEERKEDEQP